MRKKKKKKKKIHGEYYLETSKGYFKFNTNYMKGRAFIYGKFPKDISLKTHPKMVRSIIYKGIYTGPVGGEHGKNLRKANR